jgi:hypothetical protein
VSNLRVEGICSGQFNGSPLLYSRFSIPELLLFLPSSSSIVFMRMSGPRQWVWIVSYSGYTAGLERLYVLKVASKHAFRKVLDKFV